MTAAPLAPLAESAHLPERDVEAPAYLVVRDRIQFSWHIPACPFCWLEHSHGGGLLGGDPRRFLNPRMAHCLNRPPSSCSSYRLVDLNPERTAEIFRAVRKPD